MPCLYWLSSACFSVSWLIFSSTAERKEAILVCSSTELLRLIEKFFKISVLSDGIVCPTATLLILYLASSVFSAYIRFLECTNFLFGRTLNIRPENNQPFSLSVII